jgi:predicted DNA-binding transcriptional regulator YafY
VTVRVAPEVLPRLRHDRIERLDPPAGDGWTTVTLRFDVDEEACAYVLGVGTGLEVVAPAALREQVIARAARVVAFYQAGAAAPAAADPPVEAATAPAAPGW